MLQTITAKENPALGLYRTILDDGTLDLAAERSVDNALLLRSYREMKRLRALDEQMLVLQRQGRIGFYGEAKGQEATPVAAGLVLEPDDWVFPALREGAIMLIRGFPLELYLAQCFGNAQDILKGRQMPNHHSGRQVNHVAWSSCIGPQLPHAVGAAWAMKLQRRPHVAVGFLGDGATSQSDFHSAMNFAGVYKVPCVLICQNNHWAISVPSHRQSASTTFASKAQAYGIPGVRVDGNDVLAIIEVVRDAVARARAGKGATLIESVTYRMGAHSSSDDPSRYRSSDEVAQWIVRDPIDRLRRVLVNRGLLDEAGDRALEATLLAEMQAAIKAVESAPRPDRASLFEDVFASLPWHLAQQRKELLRSGLDYS